MSSEPGHIPRQQAQNKFGDQQRPFEIVGHGCRPIPDSLGQMASPFSVTTRLCGQALFGGVEWDSNNKGRVVQMKKKHRSFLDLLEVTSEAVATQMECTPTGLTDRKLEVTEKLTCFLESLKLRTDRHLRGWLHRRSATYQTGRSFLKQH